MRHQNFNIMKVKGTEAKKQNQKQWSRFQSLLYQQVMGEVLSLLQHAAYWGAWIKCANETERQVYPFILCLIANNQEWYVTLSVPMLIGTNTFQSWTMLAMRGAQALKPCTICHVPREALHQLDVKHSQCFVSETQKVIQKAQRMSKGPVEELLQIFGLQAHKVCLHS